MRRISPLLSVFLLCGIASYAVPARREPFKVVQPDGSTLVLSIKGDEFAHVLTTQDGCAVVKGSDGFYYYAGFDAEGNMFNSGGRVGRLASPEIINGSRHYSLKANRAKRFTETAPYRLNSSGVCESPEEDNRHHFIVLMAAFSDLPFTHTRENLQNLLTQKGYAYMGATGSALDYFTDQCGDRFDIAFDVAVPVTLSKGYAYYGEDDGTGCDKHDIEAFFEACRLADTYVDFSQYDGVFMYYSGGNPADGGEDSDHIWPKAYTGIEFVLDGKTFTTFAMSSELRYNGRERVLASIGTFCHEFAHTLGLRDMYDVDYEGSGGTSSGLWGRSSLMDYGNYNNGGNTPPCFNAVELEMLGIVEADTLDVGSFVLDPLSSGKRFVRMEADTPDEYYLFECRNTTGWDKYIEGSGLLIYHVDKSDNDAGYCEDYDRNLTARERWRLNEVNSNPSHECADLIEARAQDTAGDVDRTKLFFPYPFNSTASFGAHTVPAFTFWSGEGSWLSLNTIKRSGESVSFEVSGPLMLDAMDVFQDAAILSWHNDLAKAGKTSCTIYWGAVGGEMSQMDVDAYDGTKYAVTLEGLSPKTEYKVRIAFSEDSEREISVVSSFVTAQYYGQPFIYFNGMPRAMGYFRKGSKLPLRVYNAEGAEAVNWYLNGERIRTGADGYYVLQKEGEMRAVIDYSDGTSEIIIKKINLK